VVAIDAEALEKSLRSEALVDRELAAKKLAEAGEQGARALIRVATDQAAPSAVRVTAARYLPVAEDIEGALASLLSDPLPVLRFLSLQKAEQVHATRLAPLVEALTRDPATFWDLDTEIAVREIATRVLASLTAAPPEKG
jgi:hypothetical protein